MPEPSRLRRLLPVSLLALAAIVLWLVVIDWPEPVSDYLDASWTAALVDAHEHGRSFGNGIIFSAGPLGFLHSHYYLPGSLEVKLWWETVGKLLLAVVFVAFAAPLPPARRAVFLVLSVLLITCFPDTFFSLLLALAVLQWLLLPEISRWRVAVALVLVAFLAQLKFTHCLFAACGVALAAGARAQRRDWRGALAIAAGFVVAFLGFWLVAGQNPVRLWDYFRYSWQISSGYPWAMSFDESWPVFFAGAGLALLCAAIAWRIWRNTPGPRLAALPLPLFLAAGWFLAWKHGFTRADGHVLAFFLFCLLLAVALPSVLAAPARRWWFDLVVPCGLLGAWLAEPDVIARAPANALLRLRMSAYGLAHPGQVRANFAAAMARERAAHDAPALRAAIGTATVDLINYEQGLLLLNGLNYAPRPIPQSYSVYTEPLLQKNAGFFRRASAPEFVVVRMGSIDGRFPTQDDSLVLAELPWRYDLALEDGDRMLFRKKTVAPPARELARTPVADQGAGLGQEILVPAPGDHPLWLQAWIYPSWLGRLRSALYKPPQLMMVATDTLGQETRHRIIPPIATTGFLVQPLIQTSRDFADFAGGRGTKFLRSIRFEAASPSETEFWAGASVRFSQLPELPLKAIDPMRAAVDAGVSNLAPVSVTSDTTVQFVVLSSQRRVYLVHPTGALVFRPAPEHRRVGLEFGISEGAYTNDGRTDGAEFLAELESADGQKTVPWRRLLDPLQRPEDRGPQRFIVEIPPGTTRLTLRTLPGPKTNGDWDWTYWAEVKFSP